mgnify:FL=1
MANLFILESPGKVSTVKSYLGSGYKVVASVGHVRDLPKSTLGVDIENGFAAHYINIRGKGPLISELKKEVKAANKVYLATDPDREGEAISWHLIAALNIPEEKVRRVTFNEVTKAAVKAAIKQPRGIDMNLVNSQQARRILDRVVGYKLSPFLWKTVRGGLSAGRVQSVATRIIVDRENEIRAFVPEEYWTLDAQLTTPAGQALTARFFGQDGAKTELHNQEETDAVLAALEGGTYVVAGVKRGVRQKNPLPPFITSTLQQEASRKLGFQSQRIMRVAQELYEGVNVGAEHGGQQGLITYMRTDSLHVSAEAIAAAREYIISAMGERYYPKTPRVYKSKAGAQDAHEAIRPANPALTPDSIKKFLSADQYKLYRLIWTRFLASQMESAEIETVTADITCKNFHFRANGHTVKFPGYLSLYDDSEDGQDRNTLPPLSEGDALGLTALDPKQHFTEPPPRYTEASLVKFLEEKGIGRPSTYSPIITTIISRGYVERDGKALRPTNLGEVTTKLMLESFPDVVDYAFTAQMENELDGIEHGESTVQEVLGDFYRGFAEHLKKAEEGIAEGKISAPAEKTDLICEKCGAVMVVKNGRYGKFAACPNYPACRNTKPLNKESDGEKEQEAPQKTGLVCEECGAEMVLRTGRYGSFYACSRYPACKNTKQITHDIGVNCPVCGGKIQMKRGRRKTVFYSCENYNTCKFSSWDLPLNETCPQCGQMLFRKKGKNKIVCHNEACGYKRDADPITEPEPTEDGAPTPQEENA